LYLLGRPYESWSWVFCIYQNGSILTSHMTQCHKLCHVIVVPTTHHIFKMHISYLLHSQKECLATTTLAPLTLIILFSEFSNFQKIKIKKLVKKNIGFSNICWSPQGTTILIECLNNVTILVQVQCFCV
jgi:hypothetical protein